MIHHPAGLNLHTEHHKVTEVFGLEEKTILVNNSICTYVLDITVADQLHLQHHVHKQLALRCLHYLVSPDEGAMQLLLRVFLAFAEGSGLARQLQSLEEVRQIVREAQNHV